ncbi:MAG TPA: hypothetical protein VLC52_05990, partial [Anaerolineae bacterium]|nr:hypothetical protein [Anaerolineae bacterium]
TRPQGTAFDIGAFEGNGGSVSPTPVPPATPPPVVQKVYDNESSGFTTSAAQDAWQRYDEVGGQHYGDSHAYNHVLGTGQDVATWTFSVAKAGRYAVYAWWWAGEWRPTDVPYVVNASSGARTVRVNQQINGGRWNVLGIFEFKSTGSIAVKDNATSGQDIVADAIGLAYVGLPSSLVPWRLFLPLAGN